MLAYLLYPPYSMSRIAPIYSIAVNKERTKKFSNLTMLQVNSRAFLITGLAVASFAIAGCSHKVAVKTPPPAQVPASRPAVAQTPARPAEPARTAETRPAPKSDYPDAKTLQKIDELLSRIQDAYFDYDKHNLRPDAVNALQSDAQTLATIIRQYPAFKLVVEGHADERGSEEYNLALGDARAMKAKEYLVQLGLPAEQMNIVSYGKEKPVCTEHDESCWQKNRRAHLTTADARVHQ